MNSSNYVDAEDAWINPDAFVVGEEQECKRCRGLGTDAQGADCIPCDGMGSVLLR